MTNTTTVHVHVQGLSLEQLRAQARNMDPHYADQDLQALQQRHDITALQVGVGWTAGVGQVASELRSVATGASPEEAVLRCLVREHMGAFVELPGEKRGLEDKRISAQSNPMANTIPGPKLYRAEVHGGGDLDVSPSVAIFQVDEQFAREIIKFASLIKANSLHKVERFDSRVKFLQYDPETEPEDAEEAGEKNNVNTECDCLVVTAGEFFFRTYVKHTTVGVQCNGQSISDLAEHFGLQFDESQDAESIQAPKMPRVLVVVRGGIADPVYDDGVDVEVFDWDNYNDDPEGTGGVPAHFADLAGPVDIPVEQEQQTSSAPTGMQR